MSDEISVDDDRSFGRQFNRRELSSKSNEEKSSGSNKAKGVGSWAWNLGKNLTGGSLDAIRKRKYGSSKKRIKA